MILGLTFFAALTGIPAECKMIHIYRKSSEKSTILMRHADIAIILEAAGNSSRYGSNKLLHIMEDGRPMVCRMLDNARAQDPSRLILVTQYEEVVSLAPDFQIVMNHHPELGISRSMQLGIEAAGDADAYMFCVCDQPWLTPATVGRLIDDLHRMLTGGDGQMIKRRFEEIPPVLHVKQTEGVVRKQFVRLQETEDAAAGIVVDLHHPEVGKVVARSIAPRPHPGCVCERGAS